MRPAVSEAVRSIAIMHLTDSLSAGGLERMAVNLANGLSHRPFEVHLCATRSEGPLARLVGPEVARLSLLRRNRFDLDALRRLVLYIRRHEIRILHAHGSSVFLAVAASLFGPRPRVIWHDHFGLQVTGQRSMLLYRLAAARLSGVIAVTESLAEWSRKRLGIRADRVWYVPNFVNESPGPRSGRSPILPGKPGFRIVCVANLRPQKDHRNLVRAMKDVVTQVPDAHLVLLGQANDDSYAESIHKEIAESGLSSSISWLGSREDVPAVLAGCDIGVLSSGSEGLPLALIEYGMAGLATVATHVGQCEEVLDNGSAGVLVHPSAPRELAHAIVSLLQSPERRRDLGSRLGKRVREIYSAGRAIEQVCGIYDSVLRAKARAAA